jgi:hypothetical protein
MKTSPEYNTWYRMKKRCYDPKNNRFHLYGARGITVCDRWKDSFENFLLDMGERPSVDFSIDRIDVNGNYEPKNCRWATQKEQQRNRRDNRIISCHGKQQCRSAWAEEVGIDDERIRRRIERQGWSPEQALSVKPVIGRNQTFRGIKGRRDNVMLTYNGKTQCLADWSREVGIDRRLIRYRIKNGWTDEQALMVKPVMGNNHTLHRAVSIFLIAMVLTFIPSCVMGGAHVENNVILCEPGSVVEVATDKPIDVIATTDDGKKAVCKKNIAGTVALPKSVYRQMRECWVASHPDKGQ